MKLATAVTIRFVLVLCGLLVVEAAFRWGGWESFVKPQSYAGGAVEVKRAVRNLAPKSLDFVTLGDSRAVYGFDHQRIRDAAQAAGYQHGTAAIAGMHWLGLNAMVRWLKQDQPNLKNAVLALNIGNFEGLGNGYYELPMAAPLLRPWDSELMSRSVPFDRNQVGTYGAHSALLLYREDIQDFVRRFPQRLREAKAARAVSDTARLGLTLKHSADVCSVPQDSLQSCASAAPKVPTDQAAIDLCKFLLPRVATQPDWSDFAEKGKQPHWDRLREVLQNDFRSMPLQRPIIVVLTPTAKIWRDTAIPKGTEAFALSVLQPLAAEGVIELVDFTRLFDQGGNTDCKVFWDMVHPNSIGQERLTTELMPTLERRFYQKKS